MKSAEGLVQMAEPEIDTIKPVVDKATASMPFDLDKKQIVQLNGAVQLIGGFMLATGRFPRLSAFALAASLIPTTWAGHRFWEEEDPGQRQSQQIQFFKNLSMLGGLLLASVDTEGRPGLAWRAKHHAHQAAGRVSELNPLGS